MKLKYPSFAIVFFLSVSTIALAFNPIVSEVKRPYEIISIENDLQLKQEYLGELKDYPIMYEMTSEESFVLSAKMSQLYNSLSTPIPLSLIVVRKNDRGGGVTEVARVNTSSEDWVLEKNSILGMTFWQNDGLVKEVEGGTYRVEVSTPENIGKYMIVFGQDKQSVGYISMLSSIRTTQKFFGFPITRMLASSYVYYTLGIVLLLVAFYKTWRYRKVLAYVK